MTSLRNIITVEPVCLLFAWSMFMQGPITQSLIMKKVCADLYNETVCTHLGQYPDAENQVHSVSSHWIFFTVLGILPSVVTSMFICSWSDTVGRRLPMLIPSFGATLGSIILILSSVFMHLPYQLIVVNNILVGLGGGFGTLNALTMSYITDITDTTNRTKRIGIVHAMIFLGGTLGLVTGGIVLDKFGYAAVYILYLSLHLSLQLYVIMWIKESLQSKPHDGASGEPQKVRCGGLCNLENPRRVFSVTFKKRSGNKRKHLLILICINMLVILCVSGQMDLIVLFTKHSPLSWSGSLIGSYLATNNILTSLSLLVVFPIYMKCTSEKTRLHDITLAQIGFGFQVIGFVIVSIAVVTWMMFAASLANLVSALPMVVLPSLRSQLVSPHEMGDVLEALVEQPDSEEEITN
uniref:Proton-coupled folate transporter-like n=1 Tax=Saccoglossus kowalevskii TaxID=10224 RepID=A0ABM0MQ57_SACKO|nr:PREDICTED: proton-coupled folate transporter-like [Saccoglossus kowalevskii]